MFFADYLHRQHNNLRGGIYGLLLGDAVGRPYEFKSASQLPAFAEIDMQPPEGFEASYASVPVGTWTDDGAQALALLDSLCQCKGLDLDDFADKLCQWLWQGAYTPDGHTFDCGIQTLAALKRIQQGVAVKDAAERNEFANGNGALMRVLPLALWHQGDDAELVRLAMHQGLPTHGHPRSGVACALYCLIARRLLDEQRYYPPAQLAETLRAHLDPVESLELDTILNAQHRDNPKGSGYVVDTLWSAAFALQADNFPDVIRTAIALGNDTDTTACVAGGLAGLRFGYDGLPKDWLGRLQGKPLIERLLAPLQARCITPLRQATHELGQFRGRAYAYRHGELSQTGMRQALADLHRITLCSFWRNVDYPRYEPERFDRQSLHEAKTLEEITAFFTFIHRRDHFSARPIYYPDDPEYQQSHLQTFTPATAWHAVLMSGQFETALDKLETELAKL